MKRILLVLITFAAIIAGCKKEDKPSVAGFTSTQINYYLTEPVQFTNTSSNATKYLWDFGDNETSVESNPSHIYQASGKFSVKLIADGSAFSKIVNIRPGYAGYTIANKTAYNLSSFSSFYYDGSEILDFTLHGSGNLNADQKTDTVYTKRNIIQLGFQYAGKTFITSDYSISKFSHNNLQLTLETRVISSIEPLKKLIIQERSKKALKEIIL